MVDKMTKSMLRTGMVVKLHHPKFDTDLFVVMLGVEYTVDEKKYHLTYRLETFSFLILSGLI